VTDCFKRDILSVARSELNINNFIECRQEIRLTDFLWKRYRIEVYIINAITYTCSRIYIYGTFCSNIRNAIWQSKLSKSLIGLWSWKRYLCNTARHTHHWPGFELSNADNIKNTAPYEVESDTPWFASSVPHTNSVSASSVFVPK
jgi:hypothetical protein